MRRVGYAVLGAVVALAAVTLTAGAFVAIRLAIQASGMTEETITNVVLGLGVALVGAAWGWMLSGDGI